MQQMVDIVIPVYRPGKEFLDLIEKLHRQTADIGKIILMNTEKEKIQGLLESTGLLERYPKVELHHVTKEEFDHGKTRHQGISFSAAPFFVCMTQDAIPADEHLIESLLTPFSDESVAVSYARQLPAKDCNVVERYVRQFNYPDESRKKGKEDVGELGIKTYFCSNVCAAYRRDIYENCGGFIRHTIFNEDMIYAARAVEAGFRIAYVAEAKVIHSHNYSGKQQFHRNFDLGVSQADHPEIFEKVPSVKEGGKMVKSTIYYLWKRQYKRKILPFIWNCGCKFAGYKLGKSYSKLPKNVILFCSMNKNYWKF